MSNWLSDTGLNDEEIGPVVAQVKAGTYLITNKAGEQLVCPDMDYAIAHAAARKMAWARIDHYRKVALDAEEHGASPIAEAYRMVCDDEQRALEAAGYEPWPEKEA